MREKQLAICDKDIRYLEMFQTYLMRNKIADFQILIFDNLESARDISSKDRFEILLVSEGIYFFDGFLTALKYYLNNFSS